MIKARDSSRTDKRRKDSLFRAKTHALNIKNDAKTETYQTAIEYKTTVPNIRAESVKAELPCPNNPAFKGFRPDPHDSIQSIGRTCPPFTHLYPVKETLKSKPHILIKGVVILIHINSPDNGHNQQKPENGIELKITYRYRQPEYSG